MCCRPSTPHTPLQAAAILKAEVHGIPRSSYASSAAKVAEQAAKVPVAPFQPRKGVHIETDPKKAATAAAAPAGDDESVIEGLLSKLAAAKSGLPEGYKLSPVQVSGARAHNGDRCHISLFKLSYSAFVQLLFEPDPPPSFRVSPSTV